MTHSGLRHKLEAVGFGAFVPFFFVTSGIRFDLDALLDSPSSLALVPVFLGALLLARGLPALLSRRQLGGRRTLAAGLLQSTSISFVVVGVEIGTELGLVSAANGAAFVTAGLVSVLVFPLTALVLLQRRSQPSAAATTPAAPPLPSA
jgi:Kef-type K+ transport system membrane component KefB